MNREIENGKLVEMTEMYTREQIRRFAPGQKIKYRSMADLMEIQKDMIADTTLQVRPPGTLISEDGGLYFPGELFPRSQWQQDYETALKELDKDYGEMFQEALG